MYASKFSSLIPTTLKLSRMYWWKPWQTSGLEYLVCKRSLLSAAKIFDSVQVQSWSTFVIPAASESSGHCTATGSYEHCIESTETRGRMLRNKSGWRWALLCYVTCPYAKLVLQQVAWVDCLGWMHSALTKHYCLVMTDFTASPIDSSVMSSRSLACSSMLRPSK